MPPPPTTPTAPLRLLPLLLLTTTYGLAWAILLQVVVGDKTTLTIAVRSDPLVLAALEAALLATLVFVFPRHVQAHPTPSNTPLTPTPTPTRTTTTTTANNNLTPEQRAALTAAKRIVAKARAKFLAAAPNGVVPEASPHVQDFLLKATSVFTKNLDAHTSAESQPWTLAYESKSRDIQIHSAKFPGHSCMRWRVTCVVPGDLETVYDAVFEPSIRRTWDALVSNVTILTINDARPDVGDGLALTLIETNAAAGGLVRPRTMLDLALQRTVPDGGIDITNVSVPPDFPEAKAGPDPSTDPRVRATTHIGSGCSIRPIPGRPGFLKYTLVTTLDLQGWLSASVINAAMTQSLALSTRQMQDYLVRASGRGTSALWSATSP